MRVPIPNDWDGVTWKSTCIQWPDSPTWIALLSGLLTYYTRGRAWDERSGNILDVQALMWESWYRNQALPPCNQDCPDCPGGDGCLQPNGARGAGALIESEEGEMGQVVTDVTVENGVLTVWFGPCCSKTLTDFMAGQTSENDVLPDAPLVPDGEDPPTYSACGRAYAVVDTLYKVAESVWGEADNFPWQWVGHVREDNPDIQINAAGIVQAVGQVILIYGADLAAYGILFGDPREYFFDESDRQEFLCYLTGRFEATGGALTDTEWDAIKSGYERITGLNIFFLNLWDMIRNAIGRGDLSNMAQLGAATTSQNCDCPEEGAYSTVPTDDGWYVGASVATDLDFTATDYIRARGVFTNTEDLLGLVWKLSWTPDGLIKRMTYGDGGEPPTIVAFDNSIWGNSSDHLENYNQSRYMIETDTQVIADEVALTMGLTMGVDCFWLGGSFAGFSADPATPGAAFLAGQIQGWQFDQNNDGSDTLTVVEMRPVFNVNSPSHA